MSSFYAWFLKAVRYLKNLIGKLKFNRNSEKYRDELTILPGIGMKNAHIFLKAGYRTPEQILNASDESLLLLPGVGRNFLKRLRSYR
tara:strand:- start:192 stop:452 length:261 start_codon:yes stop_codon:yes gene_type:complete